MNSTLVALPNYRSTVAKERSVAFALQAKRGMKDKFTCLLDSDLRVLIRRTTHQDSENEKPRHQQRSRGDCVLVLLFLPFNN